jgi:hypothetical protein
MFEIPAAHFPAFPAGFCSALFIFGKITRTTTALSHNLFLVQR